MSKIVLKHLARDFNMDPYVLRAKLRAKFGVRRRWRWDDDDPQLKQVRDFLKKSIADADKSR